MTLFEKRCYEALMEVPAGRVNDYASLARLAGYSGAHRAVGNAMNKNPWAPQVPCHRVVRSDGSIGGFASDVSVKIQRLDAEGVLTHKGKIVNFQQKRYPLP